MSKPESPCPCGASARIDDVRHADILVGIPSYNNARTIGHVVRAVEAGLAKYYPGPACRRSSTRTAGRAMARRRSSCEASQHDELPLLLISHPLFPIHRLDRAVSWHPRQGQRVPVHLPRGRGCSVPRRSRSWTRTCAASRPSGCSSCSSQCCEQRFDYVAPYYLRHKHDGTITNSIVYPLTRALYGRRLRQPIGGDFGVSGRLASHYLTRNVWETDVARYGMDVWMTTTAMCDGFRVCQSFLGAKIHDAKDPGADLSDMFVQVVGTLFTLMEQHEAVWMTHGASQPVPIFGFRFDVGLEPIPVDRGRLIARFRSGVENLGEIWESVFATSDIKALRRLAAADESAFVLNDELWVRMVYDVACAFHHRALDRGQLVRAILPLYMAWVASFVGRVASGKRGGSGRDA